VTKRNSRAIKNSPEKKLRGRKVRTRSSVKKGEKKADVNNARGAKKARWQKNFPTTNYGAVGRKAHHDVEREQKKARKNNGNKARESGVGRCPQKWGRGIYASRPTKVERGHQSTSFGVLKKKRQTKKGGLTHTV